MAARLTRKTVAHLARSKIPVRLLLDDDFDLLLTRTLCLDTIIRCRGPRPAIRWHDPRGEPRR